MKKSLTPIFFLLTLSLFSTSKVRASHCTAAELLYEWVSDSTYRFYYKFYHDCNGIAEDSVQSLCAHNRCNPSLDFSVNLTKLVGLLPDGRVNGTEWQRQCNGTVTSCNGGSVPGFVEWWYTATVTLPGRCNYWSFTTAGTSRNLAITNLTFLGNLWIETTLDNDNFQGDTSPFFSVKPVPYVCNHIPYNYNNGAVDVNGDSLYFELCYPSIANCGDSFGAAPDTFANGTLPFGAPSFNFYNNPLQCDNTFRFNAHTGSMAFTAGGDQNAVIDILAYSYRNGILVSRIMRDMQIVVRDCPYQQPSVDINATYITGGSINNNGEIHACAGNKLEFDFLALSVDTMARLVFDDNHLYALPNSTITYTGYATDNVNGHFSWTPSASDTGLKVLTITVTDSMCRHPGTLLSQTYTLPIYITPITIVSADTTIFIGDSILLSVTGGSNFTWDVLPGGDSLSSLSCINCRNPVAKPAVTTSYVVTSGNTASCKISDTVTIVVAPLPNVISGAVYIDSNTATNPLYPVCKVWLIVHSTSPVDSLYAVDSTIDTGNAYIANYQFYNPPSGTYLIKAALLNGPSSGVMPAPTYDSSSIYWDSASSINYPGTGQSLNNNIVMRQGLNISGPGFISGTISSGANKGTGGNAVPGMLVFLNNQYGYLLAFTTTGAIGDYSFSNLPIGNYSIYPEAEGYKTSPAFNVNLSFSAPAVNSIDFTQHTISKTITPNPVSIKNVVLSGSIDIAPTPTTGIVYIYWQQVVKQEATVTVTDMLGRKVIESALLFNNPSGSAQLDLSQQPSGMYLINIASGTINYTNKIVLQK